MSYDNQPQFAMNLIKFQSEHSATLPQLVATLKKKYHRFSLMEAQYPSLGNSNFIDRLLFQFTAGSGEKRSLT
jgi:hypothetical protein